MCSNFIDTFQTNCTMDSLQASTHGASKDARERAPKSDHVFSQNSCVSDFRFGGLAVFVFMEMCMGTVVQAIEPRRETFKSLPAGKRGCCRVVEKFLLHSYLIFLPTAIGERRKVIKNESLFFGVEFGGLVRVAAAPGSAVSSMSLRKFAVSEACCCARAPTKVSSAPKKGEPNVEQLNASVLLDCRRRCTQQESSQAPLKFASD